MRAASIVQVANSILTMSLVWCTVMVINVAKG